jgi:hypothetical protein
MCSYVETVIMNWSCLFQQSLLWMSCGDFGGTHYCLLQGRELKQKLTSSYLFRRVKISRELWLVRKKANGCELWFDRTDNLRWMELSMSFTSLPLYPRENSSRYPLRRMLGDSPWLCTRNCVVWNGDPLVSKYSACEISVPVLGSLLWWPLQGLQNKKNRSQRKFWGQYTHCIS